MNQHTQPRAKSPRPVRHRHPREDPKAPTAVHAYKPSLRKTPADAA